MTACYLAVDVGGTKLAAGVVDENGEVLVEHRPGYGLAWIEAPPFTADLRYAESLVPEGLLTLFRDARRVCATALQARALANEPPLPSVSNMMKLRGG